MTKPRDRSNESIFDRGWNSDRPMRTFKQADGAIVEYTELPKGSPPPGPGFTGVPHKYRSGYTWWTRIIVPILVAVGIFLCMFPGYVIRFFIEMVA